MIGLMRGGRLLAENDPTTLLTQHNAILLEEIVLKLCRNDEFPDDDQSQIPAIAYTKNEQSPNEDEPKRDNSDERKEKAQPDVATLSNLNQRRVSVYVKPGVVVKSSPSPLQISLNRIRGLILKNMYVMWRNIFLVLFMIITPSLMVLLICNGIGNDPKPVSLGVVNLESNFSNCESYTQWRHDNLGVGEEEGCDLEFLSCKFLDRIPKDIVLVST